MSSVSDRIIKQCAKINCSRSSSGNSDVFEPTVTPRREAKQIAEIIEWINSILPDVNIPAKASSEELRTRLIDGTVLLQILNKLRPVSANEAGGSDDSRVSGADNVKKFLAGVDEMGIPRFQVSDLEKGSMRPVLDCLLTLKAQTVPSEDNFPLRKVLLKCGSPQGDTSFHGLESPTFSNTKFKVSPDSKFQQVLRSSGKFEPSAAAMHNAGHKFHEVFQLKHGRYADLSAAKISEMMKSNSLDNAPTQSLLSVVNGILDESIERKSDEIPLRVACLLRKVVQEIERRISTQAEHLRTQNNLFKAREEKYQSRITVLEALASSGAGEEGEIDRDQPQQIKIRKPKMEQTKKLQEDDTVGLSKDNGERDLTISGLRQELEIAKKTNELHCLQMETEAKSAKAAIEARDLELTTLRKELETAKKSSEQMEAEAKSFKTALDERQRDLSSLQNDLEIMKNSYEQLRLQMESGSKAPETGFVEKDVELSSLRTELEMAKKRHEEQCLQLEAESKVAKEGLAEKDVELSLLKQELEMAKKRQEQQCLQLEAESKVTKEGLAEKDLELSSLKHELEMAKKRLQEQCLQLEAESKVTKEGLAEKDLVLSSLKHELEMAKKRLEEQCLQLEAESKVAKECLAERDLKLSSLRQELEIAKKNHEQQCLKMETESKDAKESLQKRLKELEHQLEESREQVKALERLLEDSREKVKVLEVHSEKASQTWSRKMHVFQDVVKLQFGALQELRSSSISIKDDISEVRMSYSEDFNHLGIHLRTLIDATKNYRVVLAENRKLFNELQDLKGNIRVYCRIRPFLRGQTGRKTVIDYIGEEGEMAVMNPAKQGKEGRRQFRFNKVYGPDSTQAQVFSDTQPLIRCILDGYNVCIFAYGQTGSGKTYTMTGPNGASEEEWGVNYRALNDLFKISQERRTTFMYEVGVQMVEIYNEQVRDLLSSGAQKKLGIMSTSQPSGLAVPDATMQPVTSTADVLELMNIGLNNRAVSATAMNERSSRSHSVVSIHVRGKDLQTGASMIGNLHLVDLAGSERVDRSEVTGDRLREAQHINKSLSALGDVIFALAQKSSHVPYRNSKLTQLLQSSLGGQAKTLMFVQLNPDANAYSETMSTLKFAERVSGVELGAARSNKEGRDVKELMEQVASLKDTIAKKDDEIERLQVLKDLKNTNPNGEKTGSGSSRIRT